MSWKMIPIKLEKGSNNTIIIQSFDNEWSPNFDRITIHPILSEDEVTGIESLSPIPTPVVEGNTYTLDGLRINGHPTEGIYIKNGKKHFASSH